jgi:hypothetical protein
MTKNRKSENQFRGAGICLEATTMTVACALEEVRKTGYMSRRHTESMNQAEYNQYIDLAWREWGVREWAEDMRVRDAA